MRRLPVALALLASGCASSAPCELAEDDLLGAWRHVSGPSHFEEIAFERDADGRRFGSWLHERPEIAGAPWHFAGCALTIAPYDGAPPWVFTEVRRRGLSLQLRESPEQEVWVFERIPD